MAAPYGRYQKYLTDDSGDVVTSATVTVTDKSTGGLATLYSTRTGTGITNPTTSDATTGLIEFYADNGRYDIASVSGAFTSTDVDKEINTELPSAVVSNKSQSDANKQSYTATYSANVYTVTPEINATVWPALQAGLIIEFDLPAGTLTGAASINFNGTVDALKHDSSTATAAGAINSTIHSRARIQFDGTDWIIVKLYTVPALQAILGGDSTGKQVEIIAGVIRKDAIGTSAWSFIDDSEHRPMGMSATITASGNNLTINYGKTYTKVVSFVASPDETFATLLGATTGASAGLSSSIINMNISASWNMKNRFTGGTAVSTGETGKFTINPSATYDNAGTGTVAFDSINPTGISVFPDTDGGAVVPYMPCKKALGVNSATFNFVDALASTLYTGAGSSSVTWGWSLFLDRKALLDGTEAAGIEAILAGGSGNIWFMGVFEV